MQLKTVWERTVIPAQDNLLQGMKLFCYAFTLCFIPKLSNKLNLVPRLNNICAVITGLYQNQVGEVSQFP